MTNYSKALRVSLKYMEAILPFIILRQELRGLIICQIQSKVMDFPIEIISVPKRIQAMAILGGIQRRQTWLSSNKWWWRVHKAALKKFCNQRIINIGYVAIYIYEDNSITKQCFRTLTTMKDSVFIDSHLFINFWAKTIDIANYLQNQLLTL